MLRLVTGGSSLVDENRMPTFLLACSVSTVSIDKEAATANDDDDAEEEQASAGVRGASLSSPTDFFTGSDLLLVRREQLSLRLSSETEEGKEDADAETDGDNCGDVRGGWKNLITRNGSKGAEEEEAAAEEC